MHKVIKLPSGVIIAACLGVQTPACAQERCSSSHLYDSTYRVSAYELTPAQESSFRIDGLRSPFWDAWDTCPTLASVVLDGITDYAAGPVASGASDGSLAIRFAYGDSGVYFLIDVFDDSWSGCGDWVQIPPWDCVRLFGNSLPARDLYGDPLSNLPCLHDSVHPNQQDFTFFQLDIRFCDDAWPGVFDVLKWDTSKADLGVYGCGNNFVYTRSIPFGGPTLNGMRAEFLDQESTSVHKCQEWLVPWDQWGGNRQPPLTRRHRGEAVALGFGYTDFDPIVAAASTDFYWRNCDPFTSAMSDGDSSVVTMSCDAWGELYLDGLLDSAIVRASVKCDIFARLFAHASNPERFFTITGRSIGASLSGLQQSGLFLKTSAGPAAAQWHKIVTGMR